MIAAISAAAFLVAQYFQLVLAESPLTTGVRLLPWTATPMLVAPVAGALSDRIGQRPLMAAGMLLQACGLGWFALTATTQASYPALVVPLIVAGVGISMALPTTPAAALGAVAPSDLGKAPATNSTLQRFGGVFGIAIATAVFSASGHIGSPASFDAGFRPALAVVAGLSLLGCASALAVARRRSAEPDAARGPGPRGGRGWLSTSASTDPEYAGRVQPPRRRPCWKLSSVRGAAPSERRVNA